MGRGPRIILCRIIFFIGWLLSPFSFWNDAFINIPLSYLCASLYIRFFPADFLIAVLVFYWISNALGIAFMLASGRYIVRDRKEAARELLKLVLTILAYSVLVVILHKIGVLKPIK